MAINPARRQPSTPSKQPAPTPFWRSRGFWIYVVVLLVVNYALMFFFTGGPSRITVPYTTFYQQVQSANVKDLNAVGNSLQGDFKKPVTVGSVSGTSLRQPKTSCSLPVLVTARW